MQEQCNARATHCESAPSRPSRSLPCWSCRLPDRIGSTGERDAVGLCVAFHYFVSRGAYSFVIPKTKKRTMQDHKNDLRGCKLTHLFDKQRDHDTANSNHDIKQY